MEDSRLDVLLEGGVAGAVTGGVFAALLFGAGGRLEVLCLWSASGGRAAAALLAYCVAAGVVTEAADGRWDGLAPRAAFGGLVAVLVYAPLVAIAWGSGLEAAPLWAAPPALFGLLSGIERKPVPGRTADPELRLEPPGRYSDRTAWWMARFSRLAYRTKGEVARALAGLGFGRVWFFDAAGTQGWLARHPGEADQEAFAVLAFRGTQKDYLDILTDVAVLQRPLPDEAGQVHGGFLRALRRIWGSWLPVPAREADLSAEWLSADGVSDGFRELRALEEELGEQVPLYVTGHSLGGALATLAAHKAPAAFGGRTALYTFGSPRVASPPVAERMERAAGEGAGERIHRVVNRVDAVPHLPLPVVGPWRYEHVGEAAPAGGERDAAPPHGDVARILLGLAWWCFALAEVLLGRLSTFLRYGPRVLLDHRIGEYRRKLAPEG